MKTPIRFKCIGDTDLYELYINDELYKKDLTLDEVLKIISEKDRDDK